MQIVPGMSHTVRLIPYESYSSMNHILEGSETVSNGVEDVIHCFIHGTNDLKGTW